MRLPNAPAMMSDSAFYGMIFNNSEYQVAQLFPFEGGYSSFLYGKVVDMLYFPLLESHFPSWFPIWAGEEFIFFRPIFNVADSSITVGVFFWILFQKRFMKSITQEMKQNDQQMDPIAETNPESVN